MNAASWVLLGLALAAGAALFYALVRGGEAIDRGTREVFGTDDAPDTRAAGFLNVTVLDEWDAQRRREQATRRDGGVA